MTTYAFQVTGYGSSQQGSSFPVKEGWTINFFVPQGQVLDYSLSKTIYDFMVIGDFDQVQGFVEDQVSEGSIIDYALWDLENQDYTSGALLYGSSTPTPDIKGTTESSPMLLSALLPLAADAMGIKDGDTVLVYLNACSSQSAP